MLVVEVDDLDPESLEACLARPAHILRPPADAQELALGPAFGEFIAVRQAAGMKVSTVNRELATVRRMFNLAQEWGKATTRLRRHSREFVRSSAANSRSNPTRSYYRTLPRSRLTVGSGRKSVTG